MSTPSDLTPVWIPSDLDMAFKNTVVQAFGTPQLYDPKYVPLPWMIGFHGRSGMNKSEVMRLLCAKYGLGLSVTFVNVKMGECGKALDLIEATTEAVRVTWDGVVAPPGEAGGCNIPRHLLVIDQADVLCYEADSEMTLLRASRLREWAERNHVIIMGVFDRLPGESAAQVSPWVREAQNKFWAQFDTLLYIESPNADFRAKLFQHYVEDFTQFVNRARPGHPLDISKLTQVEYERLADFSAFATPENILAFLRKVFSTIMIKGDTLESLTVDFIEGFMNSRYGAPHICDFDARDVDNRWATACGRGPAVAKHQTRVLKKQKTQDSEAPVTNLTGFTEDNVDLSRVMRELGENAADPDASAPGFAGGRGVDEVEEGKTQVNTPPF